MMKKLLNPFPVKRRVRPGLYTLLVLTVLGACNTRAPKTEEKPKGPLTELPFEMVNADTLERIARTAKGWSTVENVFIGQNNGSPVTEAGKGILLYSTPDQSSQPSPENSIWNVLGTDITNHEDIDIKLDFMLGGEHSAISVIFQGVYELRLTADKDLNNTAVPSGNVEQPSYSLLLPEIYRAPGLWQHLSVRFTAPQPGAAGSARFEHILLNGKALPDTTITPHTVWKSPPSRLAFSAGGTAALRNILYKTYTRDRIALSGIQYSVYKGIFKEYDTLKTLTPLRTGNTDSLHWKVGDKRAQVSFAGTMHVPHTGAYLFRLRAGGPAWLLIDNKEIINNHGTRDFVRPFYDSVYLKAGDHPFQVVYANYDQSLVIDYEGPGIPFTRLTDPKAERHEEEIEPLEYAVTTEPGVQRGFFMHHGKIDTYTMAVGIPGGMNYAYDLNTYSLLSVWRGRFIDVSNMWTSRGESQRELPLGAVLELSGIPTVQLLADEKNVWQDTVAADKTPFTKRVYRIDNNGLPVFQYTFHGVSIEDRWRTAFDGKGLTRFVTVTNASEVSDIYFMLGNGSVVEKVPQGGYAIDDKAYFLSEPTGIDPKSLRIVKASDGRYALMLPLAGPARKYITFQYTILW